MFKGHQLRSIFLRELSAYFNSMIAYIFIIVFVALSAGLFMTNFFIIGQAHMRAFFDILPLILCVFIPALTMRLWAEDKKGNTFELLLTFPMMSWKLVIGKFLAAFVFFLVALAGTLFVPLMVYSVGTPDLGPIIGGYIGAILLGAFFISLGIFISGICIDQIAAFILAMIGCFFFFVIGWDIVSSMMDGWLPGVGTFLANTLGAGRHFTSFTKGVIDFRDLFYFIFLSGICLLLNMLGVEDRLRRSAKLFFFLTLVVSLVIIACANWLLGDVSIGRFDLTENKIYTITQTTEEILQGLDAPVTLKLYISPQEKMPTAMKTIEQEIKDQLEELRIKSNGKLTYKTIKMEAVTADENDVQSDVARLQKKGITPVSVKSIDKDAVGVKLVYSAIAVAYKDKDEEYIPRILPEDVQKLEYDISAKIFRMMQDETPVIAMVAPYTEKEPDQRIKNILEQMGQAVPLPSREDQFRVIEATLKYDGYDVKRIRFSAEHPIPEDADALVVIAPESLNERQRYEINRFLYQGGNVILAIQGFMYDYKQNQMGTGIFPQMTHTQVNDLIQYYGVRIDDEMLMDENHEVINVRGNSAFAPLAFSAPVKAPIQIRLKEAQFNSKLSLTSGLAPIFYLWGSALDVNKVQMDKYGLKFSTLFSSSPLSWRVKYRGGILSQDDISSVGRNLAGPFPLAVMLEGQFPDVYVDQDIPSWTVPGEESISSRAEESLLEPLTEETAKPGTLIVVGCSKMFEEAFVQQNGSMEFLMNAVDVMTLGGDLIKIRNRKPVVKRIERLEDGEKLWYRFLTTFLVPLLFILFGMGRTLWRRKQKALYIESLKMKANDANVSDEVVTG